MRFMLPIVVDAYHLEKIIGNGLVSERTAEIRDGVEVISYELTQKGLDLVSGDVAPVDAVLDVPQELNAKLTALETVNGNLEADLNHAVTCFNRGCQRCASVHRKYHPELYE